ncbi:uncharacterized protein LOC144743414 [Ciona intestinalis]
MENSSWSKKALNFTKKLNNFIYPGTTRQSTIPLTVGGFNVGLINKEALTQLVKYPDVFKVVEGSGGKKLKLSDKFDDYDARTSAVEGVLLEMKGRGGHVCLDGWRDETYEVSIGPSHQSLFRVERAATSMLGVKTYGSHMNGYVNHPSRGVCLWIARRSKTKATFPYMLDNMVAGGIASGVRVVGTMVKECWEEAGIGGELAGQATPVGTISYMYENHLGIHQDVQYCFDLELSVDFQPRAVDGEVDGFCLYTIDEVKELVVSDDFKPNSAGVTLDFLIRKGFVSPDEVPDYNEIIQLLHFKYEDC